MDVAELLIKNKKWNSVVNRLYYACFYAVSALLIKNEVQIKSHTGVKTQFFLNYIKTGKLDIQFGRLFSDLFDWRQKSDYDDFFDFTEADVLPLWEPCKNLIESIKVEINKH